MPIAVARLHRVRDNPAARTLECPALRGVPLQKRNGTRESLKNPLSIIELDRSSEFVEQSRRGIFIDPIEIAVVEPEIRRTDSTR
jgi:hypothetical protein